MYYATAGQQATQPTNQSQATRGMSIGPAGFSPISGSTTGGGGVTRGGGPPGFASRGADPNDFPALGTSLHPSSSYASQAQQQSQQQQPSPISQPGQHQPQQSGQSSQPQQQMYHQQGLVPPPPPGIAGPASQSGGGSGTGTNGMLEQLRGEEFPALGSEKDRMSNYLRTAPSHHSPPSQSTLPNGSSSANANGAATSPSAQHPESWASAQRPSPSQQPQQQEPVVRPIQQILSSPVDKWGLAALLFEIKTQMGQTDRGMLMFGEELSELGVDVTSDQQLYRTFTTPWLDSHQIHSARIQDLSAIPPHYQFPPPNMAPKMVNLSEDTLLIAFYSSPQDSVQLDAAIELYNRGWRYHIETQLWLFATSLAAMDGSDPSLIDTPPRWVKGPFVYFDPRTLTRDRMPDDYMINHNLIELTRPAGERQRTRGLEVHVDSSESSGSTRVGR